MDIKERLLAARIKCRMTQEQVAAAAGMNVTQYNGYERGRSRPSAAVVERLAAALETTSESLTDGAANEQEAIMSQTGGNSDVARSIEALRQLLSNKLNLPALRISVAVSIV